MEPRQELYKGKAKTVYATDDSRYLVMHYRDDVSAFDGVKLAKLDLKARRTTRSTLTSWESSPPPAFRRISCAS